MRNSEQYIKKDYDRIIPVQLESSSKSEAIAMGSIRLEGSEPNSSRDLDFFCSGSGFDNFVAFAW